MGDITWIDRNAEGFKADKARMSPEEVNTFYYADGTLKPYAFACGYVERYTRGKTNMTLKYVPDDMYRLNVYSSHKARKEYVFDGEHALRDARHMRDAILTA
jgi:hypothetical protein